MQSHYPLHMHSGFRMEKTTQGTFVNPGRSNARNVFAREELLFINNAGNRGACCQGEIVLERLQGLEPARPTGRSEWEE